MVFSVLSNRQQLVFVSGSFLELLWIKSQVPQRSTLRVFLFLIYIIDVNYVFNKAITINFTDDTHLTYACKKLSTIEDLWVFYRPKNEQIPKLNYSFFNNNDFKNKTNKLEWKTLFESHYINPCFEKLSIPWLPLLMTIQ